MFFCIACIPVIIAIVLLPTMIKEMRTGSARSRGGSAVRCVGCGTYTVDWVYVVGTRCRDCASRGTLEDQFNRLVETLHAEHDEACSPWDQDESLFPYLEVDDEWHS